VKWFSAERGYGFVALDGGKDVFVHISALERSGIRFISSPDSTASDRAAGSGPVLRGIPSD